MFSNRVYTRCSSSTATTCSGSRPVASSTASSPCSPAPAMNDATSTRVTSAAFAYAGCSEKPVHDAATARLRKR